MFQTKDTIRTLLDVPNASNEVELEKVLDINNMVEQLKQNNDHLIRL